MQLPTLFNTIFLIKRLEKKYNCEFIVTEDFLKYLINNNIKTIIKDIKMEKQLCNLY